MFRVDLLPFDLTTQLIKVLSIDTKREKGKAHCTAHCGVYYATARSQGQRYDFGRAGMFCLGNLQL